jgi:hypothetical protein
MLKRRRKSELDKRSNKLQMRLGRKWNTSRNLNNGRIEVKQYLKYCY